MSSREREEGDLVRDLMRPEAYGAGVQRVTLRTTHASWVFLTETDVFKVKRPVDLGFLDYRTLEDRHRACLEEVRLNARLAPDVYLGVVPVYRRPGGHALAGGGAVADWAVHMRRLPDAASAAAMVAGGALDAGALESVANLLAEFLGAARQTPAFGTPAALAKNVRENLDQTRRFAGNLIARATFDAVAAFQQETLTRHEGRFLQRIADERIREGHGDVRLEHIYFLGQPSSAKPVIIDAIEFNERFRCGDVAAEIAFPAMELQAAGRPELANGLVARFAEAADDYGLYAVLDFYVSYRAWVRGKVAAFVATDDATDPEARPAKETEARRCFELARAPASVAAERPCLIAVGGVIGSGKSTLARALGRALAVPVVSSDRTRKALAGLAPTAAGDARLYTPDARDAVYDEILRRAGTVLNAGRGVVVDATFATRAWRARAAAAATAAGARFALIEARVPADVARARLAARRTDPAASDATEALLDDFLRSYESFGGDEPGPRLAVDMAGPLAAAVSAAMRGLAEAGIPVPARQSSVA
ncbi:MAG TPA: AAA family ATPase [Polyangia bacterium]|nr:AAA family ATPase [Polyangia bacterium]